MSVLISFSILVIGIMFDAIVVSKAMIIFEIVFSLWFIQEIRILNNKHGL